MLAVFRGRENRSAHLLPLPSHHENLYVFFKKLTFSVEVLKAARADAYITNKTNSMIEVLGTVSQRHIYYAMASEELQ